MEVIAIVNQKGGIGKTTTATSLASILTSKGYNTILLDLDPQRNASDTYRAQITDSTTIADVLLADDDDTEILRAIQETEYGKIIASDPELNNLGLFFDDSFGSRFKIKKKIDYLKQNSNIDFIVADASPALNKTLEALMIAATKIIIPITADRYAAQGLSDLYKTIRDIKKYANENLEILGMVLVRFKERTNLGKDTKEQFSQIAEKMGSKVFNTTIRESIKVSEAQAARMPLINYDNKCSVFKDYVSLTDEILNEINKEPET